MNGRPWQDYEIDAIRQLYPHVPTKELAAALRRSVTTVYHAAARLELGKSPSFLAGPHTGRKNGHHPNSIANRFKPGLVPANKGLRRPGWSAGRMADTQFKPGRKPEQARNYRPVGSLRIIYGNLERKISDDVTVYPAKRWRPIHKLVWEAVHGPVPRGHICVFKRGMHTIVEADITLDRIECISHAENMRRNSFHNNLPPEARQVVHLRAALNRMINHRSKKHEKQDAGRA